MLIRVLEILVKTKVSSVKMLKYLLMN